MINWPESLDDNAHDLERYAAANLDGGPLARRMARVMRHYREQQRVLDALQNMLAVPPHDVIGGIKKQQRAWDLIEELHEEWEKGN